MKRGREHKGTIRQKTTHCGKRGEKERYREIDIYASFDIKNKTRGPKINKSTLKQKKLNDKRARRYFNQLVQTNFKENDLHISLTYNEKHKPETLEAAEKNLDNFLRRLKRKRAAAGLEPLKYVAVTEHGGKGGRIHHHLIVNGGLSRDDVEATWATGGRGKKKGEPLGYANADRLQLDPKRGLEALTAYLMKDPKGRKRWSQSRNLLKPWESISDTAISGKALDTLLTAPEDSQDTAAILQKLHKGYHLLEMKREYIEEVGLWYITAKMYKPPS